MSQEEPLITVPLLTPIVFGDTTVAQLSFREAEVGDLIDAADCKNEMERIAVMMASVTGQPLSVIRKLKARDLKAIMKKVGGLLGNEDTKEKTGSE